MAKAPADQAAGTGTRGAAPCYVRPRQVVVLGTAGGAHRLTDALRASGLSVGSWLIPPGAGRLQVRQRLRRDLDAGGSITLAAWRPASLILSLFTDPLIAAETEKVMFEALRADDHGPQRLHLAPVSADSSAPRAALRAPLIVDILAEQLFLPPDTRTVLEELAHAQLAEQLPPYTLVLCTLLASLPGAGPCMALPRSAPQKSAVDRFDDMVPTCSR